MSDPIVLSHDADTGITDYFHVLEDGKEWAVESRQDISGLVEVNHELQKLDDGKWGDGVVSRPSHSPCWRTCNGWA